jgi:hypothetical protein
MARNSLFTGFFGPKLVKETRTGSTYVGGILVKETVSTITTLAIDNVSFGFTARSDLLKTVPQVAKVSFIYTPRSELAINRINHAKVSFGLTPRSAIASIKWISGKVSLVWTSRAEITQTLFSEAKLAFGLTARAQTLTTRFSEGKVSLSWTPRASLFVNTIISAKASLSLTARVVVVNAKQVFVFAITSLGWTPRQENTVTRFSETKVSLGFTVLAQSFVERLSVAKSSLAWTTRALSLPNRIIFAKVSFGYTIRSLVSITSLVVNKVSYLYTARSLNINAKTLFVMGAASLSLAAKTMNANVISSVGVAHFSYTVRSVLLSSVVGLAKTVYNWTTYSAVLNGTFILSITRASLGFTTKTISVVERMSHGIVSFNYSLKPSLLRTILVSSRSNFSMNTRSMLASINSKISSVSLDYRIFPLRQNYIINMAAAAYGWTALSLSLNLRRILELSMAALAYTARQPVVSSVLGIGAASLNWMALAVSLSAGGILDMSVAVYGFTVHSVSLIHRNLMETLNIDWSSNKLSIIQIASISVAPLRYTIRILDVVVRFVRDILGPPDEIVKVPFYIRNVMSLSFNRITKIGVIQRASSVFRKKI